MSLASAARAVLAASNASSLPRSRRSLRSMRPTPSHALSACLEVAAQAGAVAAGALDRPGTAARRVLLGNPKQLAVAVRVRRRCRPGDNGAGRRRHDRHHMLVAVSINAKHVVQFVCKHQPRSSDSNS